MRPGLDPRAEAATAALTLMRAGAEPDAEAVRAAWEASDRRTDPEPPAAPVPAVSVAHSLTATAVDRDEARYAWSDRVIGALERVKAVRGVPLELKLPPHRHPFERRGCADCNRGFVEDAEDGSRVAPCPSCRPARAEGETR